MKRRSRRNHSPASNPKWPWLQSKGVHTAVELGQRCYCASDQITQWKTLFVERAAEVFGKLVGSTSRWSNTVVCQD